MRLIKSAIFWAVGVLPVPPTVILPMEITQQGSLTRFCKPIL